MVQIKATDTARSLERKAHILSEASKAFREKGFHATGMRDIAARMGVTGGSLYYYFESKEDLLAWCQDQALTRLLDLANKAAEAPVGPDSRLFLLIVGHVVALNETIPGSLAHLEVVDGLAADRGLVEKRRRYERAIRDLITDGINKGVFSRTDPKVASLAILGAGNWTVRWFRPEGDASARDIGGMFARQLVGGLLSPGHELGIPDPDMVSDVVHATATFCGRQT